MKATGIVRRIDDLGRVVIPKEIRRTMRIREGEPLEIFTESDSIILKKYDDKTKCAFCGEDEMDNLVSKNGVCVCRKCLNELWLEK